MNAHKKGWIAGAVWGVAEVLRAHGAEVVAKDMLRAIGRWDTLRKYAEPCDVEEVERHPWVFGSDSSTVIKDLQGNPLDLKDLEVEMFILNATPEQRAHLEMIGRENIKKLMP